MIDKDIDKKIRLVQSKLIKKNQTSCSYSKAINYVLNGKLK